MEKAAEEEEEEDLKEEKEVLEEATYCQGKCADQHSDTYSEAYARCVDRCVDQQNKPYEWDEGDLSRHEGQEPEEEKEVLEESRYNCMQNCEGEYGRDAESGHSWAKRALEQCEERCRSEFEHEPYKAGGESGKKPYGKGREHLLSFHEGEEPEEGKPLKEWYGNSLFGKLLKEYTKPKSK